MTLRLGVPNKGRLNERTIELLRKSGLDLGEDIGRKLYVKVANQDLEVMFVRAQDIPVGTGSFGADMQIALVNDGPVTVMLESDVLRKK